MKGRLAIRIPLLLLAIGTIARCDAHADSSWELRQVPNGSGICVENCSDNFLILGDFEGAQQWYSTNGGLSSTDFFGSLPTSPENILAFCGAADTFTALGASGYVLQVTTESHWWNILDYFPDSLGTPTTIWDTGPEVWLGTEEGHLFGFAIEDPGWQLLRRFDSVPIRQIASRGSGRAVVLLGDGRLFAQDSVWIEAPFRASVFSLPATEPAANRGHALEADTHHLWQTTDGGITWSVLSTALSAPEFAPWVSQARKLIITSREPGLGLIPCGDVLLASEDTGLTWRIAASGTGMFLDVAVDDVGRGDIVTAGARIHRSTDRAASLTQIVGGDFSSIVMGSPWTLWALDRGLLLSVDRGWSWLRQPLPEHADRLQRIAARGDYEVWLHFDGPEGCSSYYSGNRGVDLESLDPEGMLRGIRGWSFPHPGIGWAITDSTVLRSDDDGSHWQVALDELPGIDALATHDSTHVAVSAGERIYLTRDGGTSWKEGTLPDETAFRALAFSGTDTLVGAGRMIVCLPGDPPWDEPIVSDLGDTLHGVAMSDEGLGWAAGNAGLLVETVDRGCSWSPYRVDLQISALRCRFPYLSASGPHNAITGAGTTLLRLSPDGQGPHFHVGISMNPYLPRYLDIHVTAHELLLDGSLQVRVDGEEIPVELFDPDGFLYRARYRIPMLLVQRQIGISGQDLHGNGGWTTRYLATATLDRTGVAHLDWDGETLLMSGSEDGTAALMEEKSETSALPHGWIATGRTFQIATHGIRAIHPTSEGRRLARWIDGSWEFLGPEPAMIQDGTILVVARDPMTPPAEEIIEPILRVFPLPANDILSIEWGAPRRDPLHWEIFDVTGRRVSSGVFAGDSRRIARLRTIDSAGRPMTAGIYWLRMRAGSENAVRRILVTR